MLSITSVMANVYESLSLPGNRVASLNLNNSWPNSVRSDRAQRPTPALRERMCRSPGSRSPLPSIFRFLAASIH